MPLDTSTIAVIDASKITTIEDISQDVNEATGTFDKFMLAARAQILAATDNQEITQSEAGEAFAAIVVGVLSQSIQFEIARELAEEKVIEAKIKNGLQDDGTTDITLSTAFRQSEVYAAQRDLYKRQKASFDDNKYQKILESQLNYSGMVFQDAETPIMPDMTTNASIEEIYAKTKEDFDV